MFLNIVTFNPYSREDKSSYPDKRGQYLIVYHESGSDLEYYSMVYFIPENDELFPDKHGFFIDKDCSMANEVQHAWNWVITKVAYLPNLLRVDGLYV